MSGARAEAELTLRPARDDDREFLFALLKTALGPYIEQSSGWREDEQRARHERSSRLPAHQIVEASGERIGCLDVDRRADAVKLNRVFLLPTHQGRGLGTRLARAVLAEADAAGLPVRLRVLRVNPAQRLWRRLGFDVVGETETHLVMERPAAALAALS